MEKTPSELLAETERRWEERLDEFFSTPMTAWPKVKAVVNTRMGRAGRIMTHARATMH